MTSDLNVKPKPIRVSLVEDDEDIREHMCHLLRRDPDLICLSRHASAEEACEQIPALKPDVVLMDINLPGMSGIEAVHTLKRQVPSALFVMLTIYEDSDRIFQSLVAGASGYLLKRTPGAKLLEAIHDVYQGGSPMSSHIARKVVRHFNQRQQQAPELERLSKREREVLEHLSQGALYKEIADLLGISLDTVRKHLQSIYGKLHVHSRTEAVVKYLQR